MPHPTKRNLRIIEPEGDLWSLYGLEAEELYVARGMSARDIASYLAKQYPNGKGDSGKPPPSRGTLNRWKSAREWKTQRIEFNRTPLAMENTLERAVDLILTAVGKAEQDGNLDELHKLADTLSKYKGALARFKGGAEFRTHTMTVLRSLVQYASERGDTALAAAMKGKTADIYDWIIRRYRA